ncbi:ADIPOR-like receptor SPBC12C2.09c [Golovinomyces cichoracearum]|uniref:ADIPOR-like receptor SPBC12C2.09c n=1 Tax=Golovinomyces cichoracearum TaxID=62708 RepID=A0A420J2F6_9PEZI|nr:ADIPOR-like receptor SPBC12C2.09c [Golovinomyces cichoracearum]
MTLRNRRLSSNSSTTFIAAGTFPSSTKTLANSVDSNIQSSAVPTTISKTTETEPSLTVSWNDLPKWQQDNNYIRTGYRPASGSFHGSFASITYLHNESVNIHSHLFGAIVFILLGFIFYFSCSPNKTFSNSLSYIFMGARLNIVANTADILVFGVFFAGAASCLAMSGTYHTISNHSPTVSRWGNKMDYIGIVCLIVGSFIPSIFYGFYCHTNLQKLYWIMISTLGMACAAATIIDRFRTPAWRPYRATMFIGLGLSAVFPVLHGIKIFGLEIMRSRIGLTGLLLEGFFYISGASIYAARWPERIRPGYFDIWGSSHQIFHILVLIAAGCHMYGLCTAFNYHHQLIQAKCDR